MAHRNNKDLDSCVCLCLCVLGCGGGLQDKCLQDNPRVLFSLISSPLQQWQHPHSRVEGGEKQLVREESVEFEPPQRKMKYSFPCLFDYQQSSLSVL